MVIVNLKGGLGNQMFQYAAARSLTNKNGPVYANHKFLEKSNASSDNFTARSYELNIFSELKIKKANSNLLNIFLSETRGYKIIRGLRFGRVQKIIQQENEFIDGWDNIKGSVYLDGYFVSEEYFKNIRNILFEEFAFPEANEKNKAIAQRINSFRNPISIHVRRGDYLKPLTQNYHGLLPTKYYKEAMEEVEKKIIDPFYFIFSDDPGWCQEFFFSDLKNYEVVNINDPATAWQDMYLMTLCKHHIIANSTFSWWGAWLCQKEEQLNIAPSHWFNPAIAKFDIRHIIPSSWHIIEI